MRDVDKVAEQLVGMAKKAVRDFSLEAEAEPDEDNNHRYYRAGSVLREYMRELGSPECFPDNETVQDLIMNLAHWLQRQSEEDT